MDTSPRAIVRRGIGWLLAPLKWSALLLVVLLLVGNWSFATSSDIAHRTGDPASAVCKGHGDPYPTALADFGNDERLLIERTDPKDHWAERLACAIQTHAVSRTPPGASSAASFGPPLRYHLAFLEYREDGSPQSMIEYQDAGARPQVYSQYRILRDHLKRQKANYVLVFVHGWRHDSDIGDGNVADTRIYAASVARFIADRCAYYQGRGETPPMPYCDMEVTAVYVGWRGARVDEKKLTRWFGTIGLGWLGTQIGQIAMMPTLFDRKPVSEQIGPALASTLHAIDEDLDPVRDRMIVFGHSLGGNMLMTATQDTFVKAAMQHEPGTVMTPPFGNLIVLINPASEAAHWTAIQRVIWQRVAYRASEDAPRDDQSDGSRWFPRTQKPILVSVTAAHTFPPGGIWAQDCFAMLANQRRLLDQSRQMIQKGVEYDWATYDLFPLFKGDLRPAAGTLARWAASVAGDASPYDACSSQRGPWWREWAVAPVRWLAGIMQTAPFMTTDLEQTRTIGNLDPPRAAYGTLEENLPPAKDIGTTHELMGHDPTGMEQPVDYAAIGYSDHVTCPIATNWLGRARAFAARAHTHWESDQLAGGAGAQPAATFVHGFENGGMAPITSANDPFWNIRAFDNTLARHDGYLLTTFICAMNQLVMDDIATGARRAPSVGAEPVGAQPAASDAVGEKPTAAASAVPVSSLVAGPAALP